MRKWAAVIAIFLGLVFLPQFISTYYVNLLALALIYAIFAMSLDLVFGYMDMPTLGHAAFSGVAAYAIGIFSKDVLAVFWLNFLLGIGMACVVAALFGLLALRTREAYFFMITLAMAQMLWGIAIKWRSLTRGEDGISSIPRPYLSFLPWSLGDASIYFYFVLFFFIIASIIMYIMVRSPFGHVISGIRECEQRMRALGFNTKLYNYIWFIIAGCLAGVAGNLLVYYNGFVSPADVGITTSAEGFLMVLLGGPGTLIGPAIGAVVIVLLKNIISGWTTRWLLFIGLIYVLVVIFTPNGILGLVNKFILKKRVTT
ncbi:MAG: branched-chain amino acid ABC transporter permease [Thermodesulfobacteriota bacterium]